MIFKKKKEKKDKKPSKTSRYITILIWKLFKKGQLRERMERLNAWAIENKKLTAGITIGLLSFSLMLGVLRSMVSMRNNGKAENPLTHVEDVNPMLQQMQQIQNLRALQRDGYADLVTKGKKLKDELDSLMAIEDKSHEDSLQLMVTYKQLQIITRNLRTK